MMVFKLLSLIVVSGLAYGAPPESADLLAKGKAAFKTNCAVCHGEKGDSNSPTAAAMKPKPRNLISEPFKNGDTAEKIFETVTKGLPGTTMVAFAHIPEETRWGIAYFVKSLRKPSNAKPGTAKK